MYYAASLFKLALLLEAYRQHDAGEIDFSELLTLEKKYADYDLGTLEDLGLAEGDMLTVADALKAMIIVSDTPTAVMIQDLVNPARVNQTLRSLGINDMSVTTYDLPTTAGDMALLMAAVAAGEGVSEESRREMLALLLAGEHPRRHTVRRAAELGRGAQERELHGRHPRRGAGVGPRRALRHRCALRPLLGLGADPGRLAGRLGLLRCASVGRWHGLRRRRRRSRRARSWSGSPPCTAGPSGGRTATR